VLGFGAYHVLEGYITLGEMTILISYIAAVYQPLTNISETIGMLHQSMVFLNASMTILAEKAEVVEKPDAIDIGRSSGAIEFEDVSFSYKGRQDTIKEISFKCNSGDRIAVVGPTGAGKTTLMNLLVRFYDPASGVIRIDGHDTRDLTLDCLRDQMSLVMQTPLLFSGSIADNIRYGKLEATMDEIVEAAKKANCHDFISGFPEGYETTLGEGGAQLSGG
jgi:ATP-binding cassette, subfamily B, bacterial